MERPAAVEEEELGPPPPPPPPRHPLLWPWLLLLLLIVAGGLIAAWLLTRDDGSGGRSTVNVPRVLRLREHEAVARLSRRGLDARVVTRAAAAAPGIVVAQNPRPGVNVTRDSVVALVVSGTRQVVVPDVVGRRAVPALAALRLRGLRVRIVGVPSERSPGTVLAQSPAAGTTVTGGSTVLIRVSRALVTVPNAVGKSRRDAVKAVRSTGLRAMLVAVPSSQAKGTVVAQAPRAGERVARGTSVRLNVSNGKGSPGAPPPPPAESKPATVVAPDVTGRQQALAQHQLNSAGLKAGVVYVPSDEPEGSVVSQSPEAGTQQDRGTRIQLNVSLGPSLGPQRAVPDVKGLGAAVAQTRLQSAGFEVQTLPQGVTDAAQVGKVVDEQPAGGKRVPVGSTVTIYVGRPA